jgi:hypothetical protein
MIDTRVIWILKCQDCDWTSEYPGPGSAEREAAEHIRYFDEIEGHINLTHKVRMHQVLEVFTD